MGISSNTRFSQQAFADFLKLNYPLLSDSDLKAMTAYGVLNTERRLSQRSYFIVDKQGVIRYKKVLVPKEALVPNEVLLAEIQKINQ